MIKKVQGFTLIELLAVLFVVTIGLAAVVKFQSNYFYYYDQSKQQAEAIVIANNKLESLRAFDVINTTVGHVAYDDIITGTSTTAGNNATFTNTWTVTTFTNPNYKTVNCVVTWLNRRGATQSVTVSAIISQIDPATSGSVYY